MPDLARTRLGPTLAFTLAFAFLFAASPAHSATALAELIAALETTERYDQEKVAAAYRETVLSGAGIGRAVARLSAYARAATLSREGRAACHLAIAHLQWRDGAVGDAIASSDQALENAPTPDALLLKARLLDAGGEEDAARAWYRRAAEAYGEGEEQWLIRVRLAMMDIGARNVEKLEELASQRDQDFRNQAAVVLALLGRPERAIELYRPLPAAEKPYPQHVRLSEWALQAESHELAREQAWLAYAAAPVRVDRLYALSLLAESYRSAGELDRLLEHLASRDPADQDLLRLRVETLIETEAYHEAIVLYEQLDGAEADIAERRRLVALYEAAGDTGAMVREYRRMMDARPDEAQWYDGLAAHYLNRADSDAALAVWELFEAHNAERPEVLVEGALLMLQMGFVTESVAMVERHLAAHGEHVGALLFLFETWLERGEDEQALEALVRLEAFLPPDAAELVELADAYERLSHPQEALRIFETIRNTRGELGYDDQMRLAWLYTIVDRKPEALGLWRDIWVGVESPARRSFAESQLLLLAAELGALGELAVELEGMLTDGAANRSHMNLLVRIYTEAGDKLSATEIIDEFAEAMGEDEVGHQELLAQVYMLLEDYPAHDRALRRLHAIDPANRVEHIKSIIINLLTFDLATGANERFEEIRRWIDELRAVDEESVTGEFEASVFAMAGFADQAVEAYRRALVEQPENSDNMLLLADVMSNNGQTDEAVAILQYFAENATGDNEFVVAVDGILNLIGATSFFQQPDPEARDKLRWTRRVILERIAGRANKFYLYELLADIAREQGDTEASFVALENSLAEAGLRRPAVLRELLTMATPNAGFGGFSTGSGDIDRQLRFGRRLVGLRQQLPPEVYIDVGKSLLAREDISGAERAFEMIDDITGMIDIDRTKAEIFEQAGYDEQSREFYNRALNVNRDSLELLHKTALQHEVIGREDVAWRRYLQAIGNVLRRQATVLAAGELPVAPGSWQAIVQQRTDTTVTREYREHYASLEQGLLLSWPGEAEESAAAAAELKTLFDTELRNVLDRSGEELLPLARYARLDRSARLIRKLGFFLDDKPLAQYADLALLAHFGDDENYSEHLTAAYRAAGRPLPGGVSMAEEDSARTALSPLRRQLALAERREDFETQLQLLRLDGAYDEMETRLGERILDGKLREGLGYALGLLDEADFRRLALAASPKLQEKLQEEREALTRLVGSDLAMLLEAEKVAGRPLFPPQEVIELLLAPDTMKLGSYPFMFDNSGHWEYLRERGDTDDRIAYFKAQLEQQVSYSSGNMGFLRPLLQEKLTASQREELSGMIIEYLSGLEANDDNVLYQVSQAVMIVDGREENAPVLYRVAEYVRGRWPNWPDPRPLLQAFYAGRTGEAFRLIVEMEEALPRQQGFPMRLFVPGLDTALQAAGAQLLDRVTAGEPVDIELARAAYEREYSSRFFGRMHAPERLRRQAAVLELLQALDPEPDRYREDQIHVWLALGYTDRAGAAIAEAYKTAPQEDSWRLAQFLFLKSQQRFEEALAITKDGGADLGDPDALQQILSRRARTFGSMSSIIAQLQQLQSSGTGRGGTATTTPLAPIMFGARPGARKTPAGRLTEALDQGDHEKGRLALREAWRSLLAPQNSPWGRPAGSMPLAALATSLLNTTMPPPGQALPLQPTGGSFLVVMSAPAMTAGGMDEEAAEPRMLFDAVAEAPFGEAEIDAFLRAAPDNQRAGLHPMYEYLADASEDGKRLRELWTLLDAGDIDDHEFTLWMRLRSRQEAEFGPGELQTFEKRLAALPDPSPYQLLLAARVYAGGGAAKQAATYYKLLAARRIQHGEYDSGERSYFGFVGQTKPVVANLRDLMAEAAETLPREAAREMLDAVVLLARRTRELPGAEDLFDAFLLASLDLMYAPGDLFEQARRRRPEVLTMPDQLFGAGSAKAVELARAYARAGELDRATAILKAVMLAEPEAQSPEDLQDPQRYLTLSAVNNLSLLYGVVAAPVEAFQPQGNPYSAAGEIGYRMDRLFPENDENWPGIAEWGRAAAAAFLDLLANGQANQDETIQLLAFLQKRGVLEDEAGQHGDLLARILDSVQAGGRPLSAGGLVTLASMAQEGKGSLPFDRVAGILEEGRLPWRQQLMLLSLYQDSDEGEQMLALMRENGLDRGLGVLRVLRTIAERTGAGDYAADLEQRIEREETAASALLDNKEEEAQTAAMLTP